MLALFAATLSACLVTHDNPTNGRPPLGSCAAPMAVAYTDTFPVFHILANAETATPDLAQAYSIVSNGLGTYTLSWTNGTDADICFNGRVTGIDAFENLAGVSGFETITALSPKQIGFASAPGTYTDGVTFFEETDPIIVDVFIGGDETNNIYYTDGAQDVDGPTGADPASFQSP
jgi:hypothetical protein